MPPKAFGVPAAACVDTGAPAKPQRGTGTTDNPPAACCQLQAALTGPASQHLCITGSAMHSQRSEVTLRGQRCTSISFFTPFQTQPHSSTYDAMYKYWHICRRQCKALKQPVHDESTETNIYFPSILDIVDGLAHMSNCSTTAESTHDLMPYGSCQLNRLTSCSRIEYRCLGFACSRLKACSIADQSEQL